MPNRDDFPREVVRALRERVGGRCSNPDCRQPTSGPNEDDERATIIGVGAHITAAAPGGPRYDAQLSHEERSAITNGIWLCQNCGRLVDSDCGAYPVDVLRMWKGLAEHQARRALERGAPEQSAAPSIICSRDPAVQYQRAEALLRSSDYTGWRRFERSTRSDLTSWLTEWRTQNDPRIRSWHDWPAIFPTVDPIIAPSLILSLSAIESGASQLVHHRSLLDDLFAMRGWDSCTRPVSAIPDTLVMLAHHAMGALLLAQRMPEPAIDLLSQTYNRSGNRPSPERMINIPPAMGWSQSFPHTSCTLAWTWLTERWGQMPWLASFFPTQLQWEEHLAAYQFLASLVEFASIVASDPQWVGKYRASTPLAFWNGDYDAIRRHLGTVLPHGRTVEYLANALGANERIVRDTFNEWVKTMLETRAHYGAGSVSWILNQGQNAPPLPA
jgi:hypothetical protein